MCFYFYSSSVQARSCSLFLFLRPLRASPLCPTIALLFLVASSRRFVSEELVHTYSDTIGGEISPLGDVDVDGSGDCRGSACYSYPRMTNCSLPASPFPHLLYFCDLWCAFWCLLFFPLQVFDDPPCSCQQGICTTCAGFIREGTRDENYKVAVDALGEDQREMVRMTAV